MYLQMEQNGVRNREHTLHSLAMMTMGKCCISLVQWAATQWTKNTCRFIVFYLAPFALPRWRWIFSFRNCDAFNNNIVTKRACATHKVWMGHMLRGIPFWSAVPVSAAVCGHFVNKLIVVVGCMIIYCYGLPVRTWSLMWFYGCRKHFQSYSQHTNRNE